MHRFFLKETDLIHKDQIELFTPETIHHALNVLRITSGEKCELVKDERLYIGQVQSIQNESIVFSIEKISERSYESPVMVDLFQCLPKGPKLELIIQKNVELGIHKIVLLESKRCIVDFKNKDLEKKLSRYQKIAEEAAKQSKRTLIPNIEGLLKLKNIENVISSYDEVIVLYENEDQLTLKSLLHKSDAKKFAVIVGPEGGFDDSEIKHLSSVGCKIVSLGNRILRTETAGFVAVTCIQYDLGDLSNL